MGTLPTIPSFADGEAPAIAKLQQLSDTAKFLAVADVTYSNTRPLWHFYKTANQAYNGTAQVAFGTIAVDTDGVYSANSAVIQTRGLYVCEAVLPWDATATNIRVTSWFKLVVGANNPNHAAATAYIFGNVGFGTGTQAVLVETTPRGVTPIVCYPGDTISVMAFTGAALTLDCTTANVSNCEWSGRWLLDATAP